MKDAVVLYPSPGIGHLISMVELGKLLLTHHPSLSVNVIILNLPFDPAGQTTTPYVNRVSAAIPSITFHQFPTVGPPPNSSTPLNFVELSFEIPKLQNSNFRSTLQTLSQTSSIKAVILDFFCKAAFDVSTDLNIPTYFFHTSGGSGLANFLYLPTIHETMPQNIKDLDDFLHMPGSPPIFCLDMAEALFDRSTNMYKQFISTAANMRRCAGLLTNTFEAFEPRAFEAISDGKCVPNGPTPPCYFIGPLIATDDESDRASRSRNHECLSWLDSQPSRSVVFLCFGSMGLFSREQLKEMATGLESSGQRFLWVVRNPPPKDPTKRFSAPAEPDLDLLLPEGFLQRTKDRGLVVKSWAPQLDVLSHDSVGGFVTHCGWNSTLEAVCAGVPMLAWPLYAEQRMNRVFLVEELKVALSVRESADDRFVRAGELEERVRELMEGEGGEIVRERVKEMSVAAKAAVAEGGSSRVALAKFVESLRVV